MKSPSEVPTFTLEVPEAIDHRPFAMVSCAAICDPRLTHRDIRVLASYCMYADKARIMFVSQYRIAKELSLDQSSVSVSVNQLRKYGYMAKAKRPRRKYGRAQTHRVFWWPLTNQREQQLEIEASLASHGAKGVAPPVPVSGDVE